MKKRFVILGLAEWNSPLPTNQHHLSRQLAARGHEVLFVDTTGTRRPRLTAGDLGRAMRRFCGSASGPVQAEPNIWRISPVGPPPGFRGLRRRMLEKQYANAIVGALRHLGWQDSIGWFFNPRAAFLLDSLKFQKIVLHLVDDLRQIPGADVAAIEAGERRSAEAADFILASAPPLVERMQRMSPANTHYFRNVVDFDHFNNSEAARNPNRSILAMPHPRVLFAGNLTPSKIDVSMLEEMVRLRPGWQWIFVGSIWEGLAGGNLQKSLGAATYLGHAPYAELPSFLHAADVLIIPYRSDASTESVCPLKFLEYLATGKPVVATPLPALKEFENVVPLAANAQDFVAAIETALQETDPLKTEARLAIARRYTWNNRIDEIEALLEAAGA